VGTSLFAGPSPFPHPVTLDEGLPDLCALAPRGAPLRPVLVTQRGLDSLLAPAVDSLRDRFQGLEILTVPRGERHKTRAEKARLEDALLERGFDRDTLVLALGGGVLTDLAGFAAGTYLRGVPWVAIPSTLLAMVDASLGGKTGVNVPGGKNLVGLFHAPEGVFIGLSLLDTLPVREWRNGLAECLKHGLTSDGEYFDFVASTPLATFRRGGVPLRRLVETSVRLKGTVVAVDPLERTGARFLLNAGHTVGHALEALSGWKVTHGGAVASGLLCEAAAACAEGRLGRPELSRVRDALAFHRFEPHWDSYAPAQVLEAARGDKKNRSGSVRYVPLGAVGRPALPPPHTAELTLSALTGGLRLIQEDA